MTDRIELSELENKLLDLETDEKDLRDYFKAAVNPARPFAINLEVDPDKVRINTEIANVATRSAALLNVANNLARMRRLAKFNRQIANAYSGPIIVSKGDSWFEYPILLRDVVDWLLDDYAVRSLDAAGDLIRDMEKVDEYSRTIAATNASIFLLSGGGNDLVAGGNLARNVGEHRSGAQAADLVLPSFDALVGSIVATYRRTFDKLSRSFPDLHILCHGYDLPMPADGPWLGQPLASRKIEDPQLQREIVALMMNRFNEQLSRAAAAFPQVRFLDGRGKVGNRWHDELHPDDDGFADIATGFRGAIEEIAGNSAPATRPRTRDRAPAEARGVTALSLHIGLNRVDPVHYQGWDGALGACEFDAEDMAAIARSKGHIATTLLTEEATRKAVLDGIRGAAARLKAGDIFFLSYAGHGGQMPDLSEDEEDYRDETWCLFDSELIDDELFDCWTQFPEGVRILVVSDSCHSGTVTRMALSASPGQGQAVLAGAGRRVRAMPAAVAARVYRSNRDFYDDIARNLRGDDRYAGGRESRVRATVRLLSGCQDNQLSGDGLVNGRFTEELLRVWADGNFRGNYADFHRAILRGMPPDQSPNHWVTGAPNPAYDAQSPFAV